MAKQVLIIFDLGTKGVNVDTDPFHQEDGTLRKAQNGISNPLGSEFGLSSRPGLRKFNTTAAAGKILGGIGIPLQNLLTGTRYWFIGRGPKT